MSNIEYYIPTDDTKFDIFQNILLSAVSNHYVSWEIPVEEIEKLKELQKTWKELRIKTFSPYHRTHQDVKLKNENKKAYLGLIRTFVKQWIQKNQKMADSDRVRAGFKLNARSIPPKYTPPPHLIPDVLMKYMENSEVRIRLIPPKKRSRYGLIKKTGKPDNVEYIQLVYDIGEHKGGPTECRFRVMLTKMFTTLYFDPADAGKLVTLYARYMNHKHEPGPWCSVKIFRIR